jgi:hypothetical protein
MIIIIFFRFGNAQQTISYTANGEASDWFLHEKGILSFSPELGKEKYQNDFDKNFFPNPEETL